MGEDLGGIPWDQIHVSVAGQSAPLDSHLDRTKIREHSRIPLKTASE